MRTTSGNHSFTGSSFVTDFARSRHFRAVIPQKVLDLTKQLFSQSSARCLEAQFVANFRLSDLEHVELAVTRLDYSIRPRTKLNCLPGELSFSVKVSTCPLEDEQTLMDGHEAARSVLNHLSSHAPSLDLHDLVVSRALYTMATQSSLSSNHVAQQAASFRLDVFMLDCPLQFQPIRTLKILGSALALSLETTILCQSNSTRAENLLDSGSDARFGYVALTKSGQFNLHLDSDPSVMSTQLVGIWVSGMTSVMDPRVWAVCLRFLLSQQCSQCRPMDSTVLSSDTSMFLVFYGAVADRPSCFEVDWVDIGPDGVATANAEISNDRIEKLLQFNLYTGTEKIIDSSFSTPGNAKDHVLLMNIAPAGGYSLSVPSRVAEHRTPSHTRPDTNETIPKRPTEHNPTLLCERHESQPQPSVSDYLSFVPEFNVPDASLLLEEGVTISDVQLNGLSANLWTSFPADVSKLDTPAVDSLASDSVPRPLPSSQALAVHDKVVHPMVHRKSLYTIDEHDVSGTYDPVRYKEVFESSSIATSHPSCSSTNSPAPNQPASGATNPKSPEHNRSAIHTILASLPASQLKRLEKMISCLLDKKGQSKLVPLSSAKSNGIVCGESSSIHPSHLVDAAVNTSKVFSGDPALSSHGRQQRFTDDRTCIRSNSKRSDDQPHIRPLPTAPSAGSNGSHASVSTRSLRVVSCSIEENKQPPRPIRTLAELRPMLRLQSNTNAHSSPSLNSRDPEADKYSMLLANIKCVLDRHSSGTSPASKSASVAVTRATTAINTERPPPQAIVTEWGDSVCDYPLHRFPLLNSHHTANPLAHSRSCQSLPSEPLGSITHRSSARDRVTGWLHAGNSIESVVQRGTRAHEEHESTQLSDETLISRLLFPTPCGQKCMETISEIDYSLSSSFISANLGHLDTLTNNSGSSNMESDEQTTIVDDSATDTDQSVFLAGLVEKYLQRRVDVPKAPHRRAMQLTSKAKRMPPRRESADVTRFGGLNPMDVSLATREYLSRHGILGEHESDADRLSPTHDEHHKVKPTKSIPPASSTLIHPNKLDACCYYASSPRDRSAISASPVPNLLDGLIIQQSPLTDTSCASSRAHASDEWFPGHPYRHTTSDTTHQILDIEHLRSLPKLL